MIYALSDRRTLAPGTESIGSEDTFARQKSVRQARYRTGLAAELWSGFVLMAKGYRILAWRCKTRAGEIDLIATRGNVLAFIEVKRRQDLETAAAAITPRQSQRLRRAADLWLANRNRYHNSDMRFDAMLITPSALPTHVIGGA